MRCFRLVVMRITSNLSGLKCICQSDSHCWRFSKPDWSWQASANVVKVLYRRQSSANSLSLELTLEGRSLMYTKNKSWPRTVPWGTPDVTGAVDEKWPSQVLCVLLDRKLLIH